MKGKVRDKVVAVCFMAGVAVFFTAAISVVQAVTRERIEANKRVFTQEAAMRALGVRIPEDAALPEIARLFQERMEAVKVKSSAGEETVYRDKEGKLGYALPIGGRGFWDDVRGYLGVSPDLSETRGIAFYQQSETPGLGAEITEPWFNRQFAGKKLSDKAGKGGLLIEFMPPDQQDLGPNQVHAVTGATGTSRAVERFLNADLRRFLEDVRPQLQGRPRAAEASHARLP